MSNAKNKKELLAEYGLTQLEWDSLICFNYSYLLPLDTLALYTVGEFAVAQSINSQVTVATADAYREALLRLIGKGWVKVVSESPEARAARLVAKGIQIPPIDSLAKIGCLDLTSYGYRMHHRIQRAEACARGFYLPEQLVWTDDDALTRSCIAGTKSACQVWLKDQRKHFQDGIPGFFPPVKLAEVRGPERVGNWRSREAAPTHSQGWKVTIVVKRVRRRRLSLPEWGAEGWINPEDVLTIKGRVSGFRFSFEDEVVRSFEKNAVLKYQSRLTIWDGAPGTVEEVFTTLNGVKTLACTLGGSGGTHFEWQDTEYPQRTKQLTIPEAVACLQEGFAAWKSARRG